VNQPKLAFPPLVLGLESIITISFLWAQETKSEPPTLWNTEADIK
jgi:hypothetical protein